MRSWHPEHAVPRPQAQFESRVVLARAALAAEALWPQLWPAVLGWGAYISASLLDAWAYLPGTLKILSFVAVIAATALSAIRILRHWRWPDEAAGRRKLEIDSGLAHRPMDAVDDAPAGNDSADAGILWQLHIRRAFEDAHRTRPRPPRLNFIKADHRALRVLLGVVLFVGFVMAGPNSAQRIAAGFEFSTGSAPLAVRMDVWITPPEYTGLAPRVLVSASDGVQETITGGDVIPVVAGSQIVARVDGGTAIPKLLIGPSESPFESSGRVHRIDAAIELGNRLAIEQGGKVRGEWPIRVIQDTAPTIGFAAEPAPTPRDALRVDYALADDFGVESAELRIAPLDVNSDETLSIELRGGTTRDHEPVQLSSYEDLTAHRWAGSLVQGVLIATDAIGQSGRSEPLSFRLPERQFNHPVARNLAAIRKALLLNPEQRERPARDIDDQTRRLNEFQGDLTIFSALRMAFYRLMSDPSGGSVGEVAAILWEAALQLESGNLSRAERDLRTAFEDMQDALQQGDLNALDALAQSLQQQMNRFLAEQMRSQQAEMATPPPQLGQGQTITSQSLQQMIQQIRDLAAAGQTEEAARLLEELREMMENLSPRPMTAEDYERMRGMSQAANELDDAVRQQRDLFNRTAQQSLLNRLRRENAQPQQPMQGLQGEQGALSEQLGGLRQRLGDSGAPVPEGLEGAQGAMEDAERSLGEGAAPEALEAQVRALERMQEALDELQGQMQQMMSQAQVQGARTDPLGRPVDQFSTEEFELPGEADIQEVQRILEILREKLSDPNLSRQERSYLRRLLRRF